MSTVQAESRAKKSFLKTWGAIVVGIGLIASLATLVSYLEDHVIVKAAEYKELREFRSDPTRFGWVKKTECEKDSASRPTERAPKPEPPKPSDADQLIQTVKVSIREGSWLKDRIGQQNFPQGFEAWRSNALAFLPAADSTLKARGFNPGDHRSVFDSRTHERRFDIALHPYSRGDYQKFLTDGNEILVQVKALLEQARSMSEPNHQSPDGGDGS